ncbi:MAG: transglutaminase family protein [Burkholderiales bacterium]|nr:transglutaminase family protein [Burkholderiales bacterium]
MAYWPDFEAPTPLQYFAALVAEDRGFALLEAAAAVGMDEAPRLDTQAVLAQIDELGARLKRRVPADAAALPKLRLLNHYFFEELGFAGNVNDYYDPRNSYLHEVLRTRRGIPITLALLYIEIGQQVGLPLRGVSFPGHFLVKVRASRGEVIIDPMTGKSLSREDLDERLAPYRRQGGPLGEFDVPLALYLQAAPPRDILARLLRNLKEIHRSAGETRRLLAVCDRLVVLLPLAWAERRDRGLVRAELGLDDAAAADLRAYVEHEPEAADAPSVRERLLALGGDGTRH